MRMPFFLVRRKNPFQDFSATCGGIRQARDIVYKPNSSNSSTNTSRFDREKFESLWNIAIQMKKLNLMSPLADCAID